MTPRTDQVDGATPRMPRLPTAPAVAMQCLRVVDDVTATCERFAALFRCDPAIALRLIFRANALSGSEGAITTIEDAARRLPRRELTGLALGFDVPVEPGRLAGATFDIDRFWRQTVRRAMLARAIALDTIPQREGEAYLIGLLLDLGIPLLVRIEGEAYAALYRFHAGAPHEFYAAEQRVFKRTHVDGLEIIDRGRLVPDLVALPVQMHHDVAASTEPGSEFERLTAIACVVGSLSLGDEDDVRSNDTPAVAAARAVLGLDAADVERLARRSAPAYAATVAAFRETPPDAPTLLREANRLLHRSVGEARERIEVVEAERDLIRQNYTTMRHAVGQYRDRAARDPLTNLLNRGALVAAATGLREVAAGQGRSLAVLFMDLDNFKRINDVFGHRGGDQVLQAVAAVLEPLVDGVGAVGRYGGEEFVAVLAGVSEQETRAWIRDTLQRIREAQPPDERVTCTITCSLGAAWTDDPEHATIGDLIAVADGLMYEAKRNGKDCAFFRVEGSATPPRADRLEPRGTGDGGADGATASSVAADVITEKARRLNDAPSPAVIGTRKRGRTPKITSARFVFLEHANLPPDGEPCTIRNASIGGIGLVTGRHLAGGTLVELRVDVGEAPRYLVGVVAFCRRLDDELHEVGLQLLQHTDAPCLSGDPRAADRMIRLLTDPIGEADEHPTRRAS